MKTRVDIPEGTIIQQVNSSFHLDVTKLTFIPIGEASWLYEATTSNDEHYVIKIQHQVDAAPAEVLAQLAETRYKWVPESLMTDDSMLWVKYGDYFFSVQQYIDSENLHHAASEPDDEYLHELGTALKELHNNLFDKTKLPTVSVEDFKPKVFDTAKALIARLDSDETDEMNVIKVKQIFAKRRQNIDKLFENMLAFGNELRNTEFDLKIVHGDMHFGNILKPDNDHLYLIDWDHTMFSLPEMDLMYFTDSQIAEIGKTYGTDLLGNRTAIQYYRNFLLVRAINFFLDRLFDSKHTNKDEIAKSIIEIFDMSPYFQRALLEY
jgi:thiamine kinase-like enzyme